jgi:hypothetical protein
VKRATFLGSASAVALTGCGGGHSLIHQVLPGVTSSGTAPGGNGVFSPAVADPIPATTLASPIVGEAARFDGAVAPGGWMLAKGQSINVADNPALFSILGTVGGGDGKAVFKLPNSPYGFIIAVTGMYPTNPTMLRSLGRHISLHQDSLGAGARPAPPRMVKQTARLQKLATERQLMTGAPRVGRLSPVPVAPEQAQRMRQAHLDARSAALERLSPANQGRLEAAVQAAVSGRISVDGAVIELTSSLSSGEAAALLEVNAAMIRPFNDRWDGNPRPNLQVDAANFLISVAITREQARAIYLRELRQGG